MNLDLVIMQVKAAAPLFAGNVAGAAVFETSVSDNSWLKPPSAYLIPGNSEAEANDELNGVFQAGMERIEIVVQFDNRVDPRGQAAVAQYQTAFQAICKAILGWNPDPERHPRGFMFVAGDREFQDRARLFYRWTFAIPFQLHDEDGWVPGDPDVTGRGTVRPLPSILGVATHGDTTFGNLADLPQE